MNIQEELSLIEKKYDVVELFSVFKTTSWVSVKNDAVYNSIFKEKEIVNSSFRWEKLGHIFWLLLSFLNFFKVVLRRKNKVLYVGAASGIKEIDGRLIDIYLPDINEGFDYFLTADLLAKMKQNKSYFKENNVVFISYLLFFLRKLLSFLLVFCYFRGKFNSELISSFNLLGISSSLLEKFHKRFFLGYYSSLLLFFFKRYNVVYIVSCYSNSEIVAALKKYKVTVVELQHGVIGEFHRGYNYKLKSEKLPIPDFINVYSEFWKYELLKAGCFDEAQINIAQRNFYKYMTCKSTVNSFVFTGQGLKKEKIIEFFKESLNDLKKNNYKITYIPHPNEDDAYLKDFNFEFGSIEEIEILKNRREITELYIYRSVAHISIYSSCHFDAIEFHGKTYWLDIMDDNPLRKMFFEYPDNFLKINNIKDLILSL